MGRLDNNSLKYKKIGFHFQTKESLAALEELKLVFEEDKTESR